MRRLRTLFHEETGLLSVRKIPFPELTPSEYPATYIVAKLCMAAGSPVWTAFRSKDSASAKSFAPM
jgi:hypothetical protein